MDKWITMAEVSERYSLSTHTIRRMISRGEIEARRLGPRLIRVNETSMLENSQALTHEALLAEYERRRTSR
jgi:excisionase family DNA binding protein